MPAHAGIFIGGTVPKELEEKLRREAHKKGIMDVDAYVYGGLRRAGWKPEKKKKKRK